MGIAFINLAFKPCAYAYSFCILAKAEKRVKQGTSLYRYIVVNFPI